MPESAAYEAFNGLRIELPNGRMLVTTKPLLFQDATRWLELLERFNAGAAYSDSLKIIFDEMPAKLGVEDMSVLNDLTLGEAVDWTVYRFFSQRRSTPSWMGGSATPAPETTSS